MTEFLEANWVLVLIVLVLVLLGLIWAFFSTRKTTVERAEDDDSPAARNQALIDAEPAAAADPIIVPPVPVPAPETASDPAPMAAQTGEADNLSQIKGVGPKLKAQLLDMGITNFAQIAAWDDAEIDRIDATLGRFQGRIRRDNWVEQARLLSAGDMTAYEGKFGASL